MYETHFGLRDRPFRPVPDCQCYYPATGHEQALAQLLEAINEDEGLCLLTGEPGAGKTILGQCLLDRLGDAVASAFVTNSHFLARSELLQALLYDLSLPYEGRGEQELRLVLTESLIKNYQAGKRTVLVVDEAHHLSWVLLEELRLLGNVAGGRGPALQTVLLGQPCIKETLTLPELAAFSQRLRVRVHLEPLGVHEAADYLVHHLRASGGSPKAIVADEALEMLARGTRGIPRLLNQATHQALKLAFAAGATQLDAEAALEALVLLGLSDTEEADVEPQPVTSLDQESAGRRLRQDDGNASPMLCLEDLEKTDAGLSIETTKDHGRSRRLFATPRRPA
jgi:type II secretory pathway predicted ATPase ExeA